MGSISNQQKQQMDSQIEELQKLIDVIDSKPLDITTAQVSMALGFAIDALMTAREVCRTK